MKSPTWPIAAAALLFLTTCSNSEPSKRVSGPQHSANTDLTTRAFVRGPSVTRKGALAYETASVIGNLTFTNPFAGTDAGADALAIQPYGWSTASLDFGSWPLRSLSGASPKEFQTNHLEATGRKVALVPCRPGLLRAGLCSPRRAQTGLYSATPPARIPAVRVLAPLRAQLAKVQI